MRKLFVFLAAAVLSVAAAAPARAQSKDIVDTAVAAGSFKTLVKLVQDADLVAVLKSPGPFTVFAPTDEAFAKVPKETLDALAKDKKQLAAVLQYHVLTSAWISDDFKLVKSTGTALGKPVSFKVEGGAVFVNDAKIVKPDVRASNGVIQVIDKVLLPPK
ncbi:MAG TPA: fasciclin domain-containing protein [Thermoanaerobaculia bacterium]|nr:fasciclin domain-containing protein [Thermoanaerobaculia bacterium]HQR68291.1 fasciclin domain-containing protein [Thermoanaerobaculia bacterium]